MKTCDKCGHAKFKKHKSGRRNFRMGGECTAEVILPYSFLNCYGDALPTKNMIQPRTGHRMKGPCPLWTKIRK